jgi:hypothetical protein
MALCSFVSQNNFSILFQELQGPFDFDFRVWLLPFDSWSVGICGLFLTPIGLDSFVS